jgi:hypothetical protein
MLVRRPDRRSRRTALLRPPPLNSPPESSCEHRTTDTPRLGRYGTHHQARGTEIPEVDRLAWGYWPDADPGEEVLGDLSGRRVLDLGSGIGKFPACLSREGARVDAVESAPAQHERAVARHSGQAGLHLICADAAEYLTGAEPYDVIYSIHGVPYINPHRLLPAMASALTPGGRFVFSALHTTSTGDGPSLSVTARPETLNTPSWRRRSRRSTRTGTRRGRRTGSGTTPRCGSCCATRTSTEVRLGVWIMNQKSRRAKLTPDKLQQLADHGLDWATE